MKVNKFYLYSSFHVNERKVLECSENVAIKNSNRKWTMNLGGNPFHSKKWEWSISPNFSPSDKMPTHGIWWKNCRLISPTIYSKTVHPKLPNLWLKIRRMCVPFVERFAKRRLPKKASNFESEKFARKSWWNRPK